MSIRPEIQQKIDALAELDVCQRVDEQINEYVDEDEIEEYGSGYDAYMEVGRGEAEADVLNELLTEMGVLDHEREAVTEELKSKFEVLNSW